MWHIVVYDNIHTLNINSTAKDICGNHNSLAKVFEALVSCNSLLLIQMSMNTNGREFAFHKQSVEFFCTGRRSDKDAHLPIIKGTRTQANLIEFKGVQKLVQLSVLVLFFKLDIVLLQTM